MWAGVVYYVLYLYFSPYETVSHPNLPDLLFLPRTSRLIDIVKLICNGYFKYHTSLFLEMYTLYLEIDVHVAVKGG